MTSSRPTRRALVAGEAACCSTGTRCVCYGLAIASAVVGPLSVVGIVIGQATANDDATVAGATGIGLLAMVWTFGWLSTLATDVKFPVGELRPVDRARLDREFFPRRPLPKAIVDDRDDRDDR